MLQSLIILVSAAAHDLVSLANCATISALNDVSPVSSLPPSGEAPTSRPVKRKERKVFPLLELTISTDESLRPTMISVPFPRNPPQAHTFVMLKRRRRVERSQTYSNRSMLRPANALPSGEKMTCRRFPDPMKVISLAA